MRTSTDPDVLVKGFYDQETTRGSGILRRQAFLKGDSDAKAYSVNAIVAAEFKLELYYRILFKLGIHAQYRQENRADG